MRVSPPRSIHVIAAVLVVLFALVAAVGGGRARAQTAALDAVPALRVGGRVLVDLSSLARRYGWSVSASDGSVTVRTASGILTVFGDSPDALWQPTGDAEPSVVPLSMPPRHDPPGWFVPEDLLELLEVEWAGDTVAVPGGWARLGFPPAASLGDGYEIAQLGSGTVGLRFFESGPAGGETVSLLLSDLALLALVVPEHRHLLDRLLVGDPLAVEHPLLVTVSAIAPGAWEAALFFEQGDMRFEARHPFRFQLVRGSPDRVGPDDPAVGVVLLPARFSLEQPLLVRWGGRSAEVTFRPGH